MLKIPPSTLAPGPRGRVQSKLNYDADVFGPILLSCNLTWKGRLPGAEISVRAVFAVSTRLLANESSESTVYKEDTEVLWWMRIRLLEQRAARETLVTPFQG